MRDHGSQRERLAIEAMYYQDATGELPKAIQSYMELIQTYSGDATQHTNVSSIYGQYEKALDEAREAIRLGPEASFAYSDLMGDYIALNRLEDAKAAFEQARAGKLDSADLRVNRYLLAFLQGDADAMQEQVAWATGRPGAEGWLLSAQSDTESYYGRFTKAREFSRRAVVSD